MTQPIWDRARGPVLPALQERIEADLLVVGLGASGLAAIEAALDRGARVAGIDERDVAAGAAGRNAGFALAGAARFHHDAVRTVGRERAAALYRRTLDELTLRPPPTFRRTGSLRIAASRDEVDDCRLQLEAMRADGLPAEWYAGPEGEGLLFPNDGVIDPVARCRATAERIATRGAALYGSTAWPSELVDASVTIVAIDGGLERVLPELAGRVRTARLQCVATSPVPPRYPRPVYRRYGYDYWQQLAGGEIVVGGCRDEFEADEWDAVDTEPTPRVQAAIERLLHEVVVPDVVEVTVTNRWSGLAGFTADGLPVVARVRQGVIACGGYSGTGNIVGVLAGRAATALALDGTPPHLFAEA